MNRRPDAGRRGESSCRQWVKFGSPHPHFRMFLPWLEIKSRIPHWSVSYMSPLVQGFIIEPGGLQSYYFTCTGTMEKKTKMKVSNYLVLFPVVIISLGHPFWPNTKLNQGGKVLRSKIYHRVMERFIKLEGLESNLTCLVGRCTLLDRCLEWILSN